MVIIIDDIGNKEDFDKVKNLLSKDILVTPSIFPKSKAYNKTPKYARGMDNYIIHLPLEATNYNDKIDISLKTDESEKSIDRNIREIREKFPRAKFINNHTGSKFTANTQAMTYLMKALKKYNFSFIDSRTTKFTKAEDLGKSYGINVFRRNIFLDNKADTRYIVSNIKKAIALAKRDGYVVVIGHPKADTIKALEIVKQSGDFRDINLVRVDDLLKLRGT